MTPRVVVLNDYGTVTGGSTAVAHASAIGLARRGCRVTLLTAVGPVAENLQGHSGLEVIGLGQQEIGKDPNRLRAMTHGLYNRAAVDALHRVLTPFNRRNTVVHVHTWTKALSPFPLHEAIRMGFRVALTLHDFFITCPTGGFFVHETEELCHRVPLSPSCLICDCDRRSYLQKLYRVARTVVQNRVLHVPEGLAHLVGVSQLSIDVMRPYLPAGCPVTIIRNPIEAVDHGPAAVEENRDFLYIGRFAREKGVLLFAEAAGRLGLPAVFIGDGEVRAEAQRLCPNGTFTGWLPPEEITRWLRRARALVFPPLWYETLGLVVVEAAAQGVAAVVASRCAATDFVEHGATGRWFEHGSAEALGRELQSLQLPGAAGGLGRNAYEWYWSDPWSTERHVEDLLALYGRILEAAPASLPAS